MTDAQQADTATLLRRDFDASFAQAPRGDIDRLENLLSIRVGGDPYAFRLTEIGGLHADKRIVPVPSPAQELVGVAGFRNLIAPIYDLGALLGYAGGGAFRWVVLSIGAEPIGLAFESFEGHLRVPADAAAAAPQSIGSQKHVRGVTRHDGVRPIIDVPSLLASIGARAERRSTKEE